VWPWSRRLILNLAFESSCVTNHIDTTLPDKFAARLPVFGGRISHAPTVVAPGASGVQHGPEAETAHQQSWYHLDIAGPGPLTHFSDRCRLLCHRNHPVRSSLVRALNGSHTLRTTGPCPNPCLGIARTSHLLTFRAMHKSIHPCSPNQTTSAPNQVFEILTVYVLR
jgi:hypothetical protein